MRRRVVKITPKKVQGYKPVGSRYVVQPPKKYALHPNFTPVPHFKPPVKPLAVLRQTGSPEPSSILVVLHLFHADTAQDFLASLKALQSQLKFDLIVTMPENSEAHKSGLMPAYQEQLNADVILVDNCGKDIIPKLIAIESVIKAKKQYDHVFLMHDKKSVKHTKRIGGWNQNSEWGSELISVLFDQDKRNFSLHLLNDEKIGLIGSGNHLHYGPGWHEGLPKLRYRKELDLIRHQNSLRFTLEIPNPKPAWFIGGTMFWIRWNILEDFYKKHGFDRIFTLAKNDKGDIKDPSFTHYLERFFGQMVTMAGMKTVGI
jgi:lipopolysaccharide biosynthesis protein